MCDRISIHFHDGCEHSGYFKLCPKGEMEGACTPLRDRPRYENVGCPEHECQCAVGSENVRVVPVLVPALGDERSGWGMVGRGKG